ncbi:hypothetical protein XELAEV_18046951mg [Xenopus laevis]|uniref:Uncharacterized protein n=1 Tax=Xenopus laevis TaxID=8355 RepID=A0A974BUD9_XENLA|nr:hypothetical protein XELAEV_18046951mg [Xenopus laevis]
MVLPEPGNLGHHRDTPSEYRCREKRLGKKQPGKVSVPPQIKSRKAAKLSIGSEPTRNHHKSSQVGEPGPCGGVDGSRVLAELVSSQSGVIRGKRGGVAPLGIGKLGKPSPLRNALLFCRQPSNLKSLITRSALLHPAKNGTYPCGKKQCKTCPHILTSDKIPIPDTLEEYSIHGHYNCSSIKCTKCTTGGLYIGETGQSLRKRNTPHQFTVTNHKTGHTNRKSFQYPSSLHKGFWFLRAILKQIMKEKCGNTN